MDAGFFQLCAEEVGRARRCLQNSEGGDNAQVEFALFRGCLSYNKINLLRTCPPDLLEEALVMFDDHFQNMVAEILRVPCLSEDQWDQASLPVKFSGLGVNQTKVIAGLRTLVLAR